MNNPAMKTGRMYFFFLCSPHRKLAKAAMAKQYRFPLQYRKEIREHDFSILRFPLNIYINI